MRDIKRKTMNFTSNQKVIRIIAGNWNVLLADKEISGMLLLYTLCNKKQKDHNIPHVILRVLKTNYLAKKKLWRRVSS